MFCAWVGADTSPGLLIKVSDVSQKCFYIQVKYLYFKFVPLDRCRPGFIGLLCKHLDPCHRSPCLNGAACKSQMANGIPQFTCVCQRGFRGKAEGVFMMSWYSLWKVTVCEWCSLCLQVRIVPWLMHVPQIPAPTVPDAPIGIITTTAHAHLVIRARTVAMILMNAANLESALTVASAWTHMAHSAVSALLGTAGAHARCPPSLVPPHSV